MGVLAATGLAGSGLAARLLPVGGGQEGSAADDSTSGRPAATVRTLYLDRYTSHNGGHGADRRSGDQSLLRGTLRDEAGEFAGELFASSVTMPGPLAEGSPKTPRMEFQNLQLVDGTIVAMGTVFAQSNVPNVYTILGGTGRYATARGTYRFDDNPSVARRLGRATIVFDLSNT